MLGLLTSPANTELGGGGNCNCAWRSTESTGKPAWLPRSHATLLLNQSSNHWMANASRTLGSNVPPVEAASRFRDFFLKSHWPPMRVPQGESGIRTKIPLPSSLAGQPRILPPECICQQNKSRIERERDDTNLWNIGSYANKIWIYTAISK